MSKKKIIEMQSLMIPTIAIAMAFIGLPYMTFGTHPIYTTIRLYMAVMGFLILVRRKDNWLIETGPGFDQGLTIIMWTIAIPMIIFMAIADAAILLTTYILSKTLFKYELYRRSVYIVARLDALTLIFIFGINVKIEGEPTAEQCIFVPNHCSDWDDPLNPLFARYPWKVVYAPEIRRLPLVTMFLKFFGIPLSRKERRSRNEVSKTLLVEVSKGNNVIIYSEGRRLVVEDDPQNQKVLMPFEVGAFSLSKKTGKPVQLVAILWTFLFKPRSGQWWVSPRKIRMVYLDPLYCGEDEDAEAFALRANGIMEKYLSENIEKEAA